MYISMYISFPCLVSFFSIIASPSLGSSLLKPMEAFAVASTGAGAHLLAPQVKRRGVVVNHGPPGNSPLNLQALRRPKAKPFTLPETNIAPESGWLESDRFLLGWPIFRGELLVSGSVGLSWHWGWGTLRFP